MIFDSIENLSHYKNIHPNLDKAIAFILAGKNKGLPVGRHEVSEQEVFLNVSENELALSLTDTFEYHKQYADIHLVMEGQEGLTLGFQAKDTVQDYQEKDDYGLVTCNVQQTLALEAGYFMILLPNEQHQPGKLIGKNNMVTKQVFKVLVD
ncbi:YhcH/YjgK/YiaL family protein [Streptococcus didelphis]|uniref:YhcH/YjgK/YiaL family protein n=1 Tax=Streptococcus didelphis TaxID=102886 RepID=A0ABY9LFR8_9STRE|nr:YhcH/YjgK/YiaL family protein [Streptococcus didelphis]WMB27756.1 YhcH/YjgK/YiaL family protein [Streptococcus didelphis]WMB29782.1 YhcH/YjgK/YiaL family protein [Streptococcus didelphis]